MKISTKGRYALAAMVCLAQREGEGEPETLGALAGRLELSKLYLEQVFSLLRRAGLVQSLKGAQGGYRLGRDAGRISALDILLATESALFEVAEATVPQSAPGIERALSEGVFAPLDRAADAALRAVSLRELALQAGDAASAEGYIYMI